MRKSLKTQHYSTKERERIKLAQQAAQIGTFEWNIRENKIEWTEELELLYGTSSDTHSGTYHDWVKYIHPDDLISVETQIQKALYTKDKYQSEFRIIKPDGSIRWILGKGEVEYDKQKNPTRMIGVNMDITERKQIENNMRFLSQASKLLASTLDYNITLETVTKLAVPHIADWCAVDILNDASEVELVAVAHIDPEKVLWAKELRAQHPIDMDETRGLPNVLRTGKSELYSNISQELIQEVAKTEEQLKIIEEIGFTSTIIVPIKVRRKTIGAITLVTTNLHRHYDHKDLEMAEELANRTSLAIENSRLYQESQTVKKNYESLFQGMADAVLVVDEYGYYINANPAAEKLFGFKVKELQNMKIGDLGSDGPDGGLRAHFAQAKLHGSYQSEGVIYRKDGAPRQIEVHTTYLKQDNRNIFSSVFRDITVRKELENRKDEFLGIASHELKTPVTSIKAYAQILKKYVKTEEKTAEYVNNLNKQIDKLDQLVQDLLDISKIQSGKLTYSEEEVYLDDTVEDIVRDMQHSTDTHVIQTYYQAANVLVHIDKYRFSQVLSNLISNAIKYSPQSDHIIVSTAHTPETVIISVQDFGIGIPEEAQQKLFERFYRVEGKERESFPGFGLGLYIAAEIIKRLRGRIWVESAEDKGSTFYIELPISGRRKRSKS